MSAQCSWPSCDKRGKPWAYGEVAGLEVVVRMCAEHRKQMGSTTMPIGTFSLKKMVAS